ncbi:MAG: DNA polymerase IV [Alphaproteobacteria bacterium]|nr:DNA polymerase IV [Alphaproteobacteria bacterium]
MCQDCGAPVMDHAQGCPDCGSPRIVTHPELATLTIAHVDCDAFYAAVEIRDNPALADGPVIVGGSVRGVVTSACYKARAFGVRSAMPMGRARALCPDAVIVKPDGRKYAKAGKQVRGLMEQTTPAVEPVSIDEAFLDLSGTQRAHNATPAQTLARLAARIADQVGITVSVGLSYNKSLAKIASDFNKPKGFVVIGRDDAQDFLNPKPVRIIWGVGPAQERRLHAAGLRTVGDIAARSPEDMRELFGGMGTKLAHLARGEDNRQVNTARHQAKSASSSTTFGSDHADFETLKSLLWGQCETLARRLKRADLGGRSITLILKSSNFKVQTRSKTIPDPTQLAEVIFQAVLPKLLEAADGTKFRLIGVRVSDMVPGDDCDPPTPFDPSAARRAQIERTMDDVRAKLGTRAISKGLNLPGRTPYSDAELE